MSIYDLPPEEVIQQREFLQETRDRQRREIIESGLASRAIQSTAFINNPYGTVRTRHPLTEGSEFHPSRRTLAYYPSFRVDHLLTDLGIRTEGTVSQALTAINPPSYALRLQRSEATGRAGSFKALIAEGYTIGLHVSPKVQLFMGLDQPLLAVPGFEDDIELVQRHLTELDEIRIANNLTLLDPETLDEEPEFKGF